MSFAQAASNRDSAERETALIPPISHWIWFGRPPEWAERNVQAFRELHPDWETRFWHALPPEMPADLVAIIESLPWLSSRSDILSYWLLQTYGGVYLDADMVVLRSFDGLRRHQAFLAPCCPEGHDHPHLNCAVIGSQPRGSAITLVLETCRQAFAAGGPFDRISFGPQLLSRLFQQRDHPELTILPSHSFYPLTTRSAAHEFWKAPQPERQKILQSHHVGSCEAKCPYAVHLWGVDGSSHRTASPV